MVAAELARFGLPQFDTFREGYGLCPVLQSALPKGRARRRGSLAVRRHRASLDPANLSAARASAETGPESGAEEAAQAVARPPLDGIPGKRLDVDVYARRAFINTFNEGSRWGEEPAQPQNVRKRRALLLQRDLLQRGWGEADVVVMMLQ